MEMDPSFYEVDQTRPFASLGSISFRRQTKGGRKKRSLFKHGWGLSRFSRNVLRSAKGRGGGGDPSPSRDPIVVNPKPRHRASDAARTSDAKARKKKKSTDILDLVVSQQVASSTFNGPDDLNFEEFPEEILPRPVRDYTPRPSNPSTRHKSAGKKKTPNWSDWDPYVPLENCSEVDDVSDWSDLFD